MSNELSVPGDLTDKERDLIAYSAYTQAHNELDPRYVIEGVRDDGSIIERPIAKRIERFKRWRAIGDAISATQFNRPTWSLVDGSTRSVPDSPQA